MENVKELTTKLVQNIENVIIGKRRAIQLVVLGLICEGHVLIEDVPGVGKTMLARSLARSLDCSFSRIQCTPDMLPSDITGVDIFNQASATFKFLPGPILNQIVLADEINRATPKTQSALLEAMQERQVTISGVSHPIPVPFMLLATQNPIEYEGTFPLPEAQLDRFMVKVSIGYPGIAEEMAVIENQQLAHPIDSIQPVTNAKKILEVQQSIRAVFIAEPVKKYIVEITQETRTADSVYLGASPRGSLALARSCQAWAAMYGRDFVIPDDVKLLAEATLGHRIILSSSARLQELRTGDLIRDILRKVPVPGGDYRSE
ncbi:MAG: MoxR family ATPase [Anaerolineales bacterium]|nr:MoxR family ATPase [Anaerolineales bacterium]